MVLEYLQIQNKACASLPFQPVRHESGIFRFECMKACLRHDLSPLVESARLVTWNRDYRLNSPPPMRSDQMPAHGKTKLINFPPSRAGKDVKCPGYARGGGGDVEASICLIHYCSEGCRSLYRGLRFVKLRLYCINLFQRVSVGTVFQWKKTTVR